MKDITGPVTKIGFGYLQIRGYCKGINDDTKRAIQANLESWEEAKSKMSSQQTDASKRKFSGDPDTSASSSRAVKSRKINVHWMAEFPWLRVVGQEQYCEWCSLGTGKMVTVNAAKKKTLLAQHQKSSRRHTDEDEEIVEELDSGHSNLP